MCRRALGCEWGGINKDAASDVAMPATARNATAGSRLPMQRWLFDVKTIFGGNGLYPSVPASARRAERRRGGASP